MNDSTNESKIHPWLKDGGRSSDTLPAIADWIAKHRPGGDNVLDAGCGNGDLLALLASRGLDSNLLRGSDIELGHSTLASARTGRHVRHESLAKGTYAAESFDIVCAINWLHSEWAHKHAVSDPKTAEPNCGYIVESLAGAYRVLKPGGMFIFDWRGAPGTLPVGTLFFSGWARFATIKCDPPAYVVKHV